MTALLLLLSATSMVVVSPPTRTEPLELGKHSALARDHVFLHRRYSSGAHLEPPPVSAIRTPDGGAFLIVATGPTARVYRIDRGNRVLWKKDDLFEDLHSFVVAGGPGDGFTVLSERRVQKAETRYLLRRHDGAGEASWSTEFRAGRSDRVSLGRWGAHGWLLALAERGTASTGSRTVTAHLIDDLGERPWGADGVELYRDQQSRLPFSMVLDRQDGYVFVWQKGGSWGDRDTSYFAQRLLVQGITAWKEPLRLGAAARYSMVYVTTGPSLRATKKGVEASLMGGSFSDIGSQAKPYDVLIEPTGAATLVERISRPRDQVGAGERLPFFRELPLKDRWQLLGRPTEDLLSSPCLLEERDRSFRARPEVPYPAHGPDCEGLFPEPRLPMKGEDRIALRFPGGTVKLEHTLARGAALPESPTVAYRTTTGAAYWQVTPTGVHTWLLSETLGSKEGATEWRVAPPHRPRERDGGVEIVDPRGRVVATVVVSGHRWPRQRAGRHPGGAARGHLAPSLRVQKRSFGLWREDSADPRPGAARLTWIAGSAPIHPLASLSPIPLADGRLLFLSAQQSAGVPAQGSELYDPRTHRWTRGPPLPEGWISLTVPLSGHRVLALGHLPPEPGAKPHQTPPPAAWILDTRTLLWREVAPPPAHLQGTQVSGFSIGPRAVVWTKSPGLPVVYDIAADAWSKIAGYAFVQGYALAPLPGGKILFSGGRKEYRNPRPKTSLYDLEKKSWTALEAMPHGRTDHRMLALGDGRVVALGGRAAQNTWARLLLFDPGTQSWSELPNDDTRFGTPGKIIEAAPGVIAWTGSSHHYQRGSALGFYDLKEETFSLSPPFSHRGGAHLVRLRDGKLLLVGGGHTDAAPLPLLYDLGQKTWSHPLSR